MGRMKLVDATQLEQNLTTVADAIREVAESEEELAFPDDFAAAIRELSGEAQEGTDLLALRITNGLTSYSSDVAGTMLANSFTNMTKLERVSLPNITTGGNAAFSGCTDLTEVYMPNLNRVSGQMFYGCTSLKRIEFPNSGIVGPTAFIGCTSLEYVDLGDASTVYTNSFNDCSALTTLILRAERICGGALSGGLQNTPISNGTGYIYVPAKYLESYKTDDNWGAYANQFRAIEDYPEICGGGSQ